MRAEHPPHECNLSGLRADCKEKKGSFTMPDICHSFRPGHRIMVQVQSSWFPLVDRNPQRFCDIYSATEADFTKQTQTIHRSAENPSSVTMWVR